MQLVWDATMFIHSQLQKWRIETQKTEIFMCAEFTAFPCYGPNKLGIRVIVKLHTAILYVKELIRQKQTMTKKGFTKITYLQSQNLRFQIRIYLQKEKTALSQIFHFLDVEGDKESPSCLYHIVFF